MSTTTLCSFGPKVPSNRLGLQPGLTKFKVCPSMNTLGKLVQWSQSGERPLKTSVIMRGWARINTRKVGFRWLTWGFSIQSDPLFFLKFLSRWSHRQRISLVELIFEVEVAFDIYENNLEGHPTTMSWLEMPDKEKKHVFERAHSQGKLIISGYS